MKKALTFLLITLFTVTPLFVTACTKATTGLTETDDLTETEKDSEESEKEEMTENNEPVYNDEKDMLRDTVVLSVFWPPMKGFTDDIQYEYLKNAHIDLLEYNSDTLFSNSAVLETAMTACEKYGLKMTVFDSGAKDHWLSLSDEQIISLASKYKDREAVIGYYLVDEPSNANPWGRVTRLMNSVMPGAVCQMNMLPAFALANPQGHAEDWINAAGAENLRYLSYDHYPFGLAADSRPNMFDNMDLVREVGLKYGVDTALYIQATSNYQGFRDPDEGEMRYHTSAALAYGFKNLKYFTWMTPVERTEDFADAIIDPKGNPTEKYEWVCSINGDIKKVANILGRCEAVDIYHSGKRDSGTERISSSSPVRPENATENEFIFSVMVDKYSSVEYLMIVNKDFNSEKQTEFTVKGVSAIYDVTNGEETAVTLDNGKFTAEFKEGGFRLYRLEGSIAPEYEDADKDNLAQGKAVYSSSSLGKDGWYNMCAVDGKSTSKTKNSQGYKPEQFFEDGENYFMIDLNRAVDINRIDVYPAGEGATIGTSFPVKYEVLVSEDGKDFTRVAEFERSGLIEQIPSHTFDTVKARYVKLVFTEAAALAGAKTLEIAEIEIYNDDGSIPKPARIERPDVELTGNFALNKPVMASSNVGNWGWDTVCAVDGETGTPSSNPGWSSQVLTHIDDPFAEEWIMIDLCTVTKVNTVKLYPRESGIYFPVKLEIQVSRDGNEFTTVYTYEDTSGQVSGDVRVFTFDDIEARYVRALAKEMTEVKSSPDGYLFQLSEFEIYFN